LLMNRFIVIQEFSKVYKKVPPFKTENLNLEHFLNLFLTIFFTEKCNVF